MSFDNHNHGMNIWLTCSTMGLLCIKLIVDLQPRGITLLHVTHHTLHFDCTHKCHTNTHSTPIIKSLVCDRMGAWYIQYNGDIYLKYKWQGITQLYARYMQINRISYIWKTFATFEPSQCSRNLTNPLKTFLSIPVSELTISFHNSSRDTKTITIHWRWSVVFVGNV